MRAVGIILAGGNSYRMKDLTRRRAIAAMPVAGRFLAIDFALSSMSDSNIQKVSVLTQYNSRSLDQHLSSSKWWDFGRKKGGLFVFPPMPTADNNPWYKGTADAIYQNLEFLKHCNEPYVVIASGDGIYKLDYTKVLEYHISKKADITVVCKDFPEEVDVTRFGLVQMNDEGMITRFDEKPVASISHTVSCGIYVISRRMLIELTEQAVNEGKHDFVRDILIRYMNSKRIYGYRMKGYWSNIASVESYYQTNMDFLRKDVRTYFFREYPYIHTKDDDNPPAKYNPGSNVRNSLIANGCIINGTVENSVIFEKVFVGSDCVIKNSIVLNDVCIGDNVYLENCIVESCDTIRSDTCIVGENGIKIVNEPDERYVL